MTVLKLAHCVLQRAAALLANQRLIIQQQASQAETLARIEAKQDAMHLELDSIRDAVAEPDQAAGIRLTITPA